MGRKVKIFISKWNAEKKCREKVFDSEGIFIQYGLDIVEYENSAASYTTAIVEMPDGTVRNVCLDYIQFIMEDMNKKERCYLKHPLKILGVTDECCCNCRFHVPLHYHPEDKPKDQESYFKEWVCIEFFIDDKGRSPLKTCGEHGICECWLPLPGKTSQEKQASGLTG